VIDLSVVIPVRDEADNLDELTRRLHATLVALSPSYEIIFVTDLNQDDTLGVLRRLNTEDGRVKVIKLSNAFGHHVAVAAGLAHSKGAAVAIMDGDLQDYPEDIPLLWAKLREGYDIVYGIKQRKNDSVLRNFLSRTFVRVLRRLSDFDMDLNTCMFRIVSRRVANVVLQFKEREPSLTFIMGLIGFPTARVLVRSGTRQRGLTKYSYWRQINLAISSLISFSTKPLRIASLAGLGISALTVVYFLFALGKWALYGVPVAGWTSLVALMGLVGGAILFAQGVTGEYIARTFLETKGRPLYVIEESLGLKEEPIAKLPSLQQ
jgi:dolichol-phosphate mannosyltransferase